jgi:hypothetical protein
MLATGITPSGRFLYNILFYQTLIGTAIGLRNDDS